MQKDCSRDNLLPARLSFQTLHEHYGKITMQPASAFLMGILGIGGQRWMYALRMTRAVQL